MMDKNTIIKNGILEQYLLGELDAAQQLEVENVLNSDSELQAYFETLEESFEVLGHENALTPPENVKKNLLKTVRELPKTNTSSKSISSINSATYFTIAASLAAFLLLGSIWLYTEMNRVKNQLQLVENEKELLLEDLKQVAENLETTSKWFNIINSPDAKQYVLNGNQLLPEARVISYVNDAEKSVVINTKKLPKLDNKKDYQMWADVEGEMINMGIIDTEQELLAMTYIDHAESLNITIEPKGGNEHPTVSRLISNVYLKP